MIVKMNNYEEEKVKIYEEASNRAKAILDKYKNVISSGVLDWAPMQKELKEDSKRVLEELKELDKKYNK